MPPSPRKNAIERRIEELDEAWNTFAEAPDPRLLCWSVDADSLQLVEGWVQLQCDGDGALPDLFIRLESAFTAPGDYGFRLLEELRTQVEQVRALLAEEGEEGLLPWDVPPILQGDTDVVALVRACASVLTIYADRVLKLGVVITPGGVGDPASWEYWLRTLVHAGVPDGVRFLALDSAELPMLGGLPAAEPVLVASAPVDLDMAGARAELAAAAATDDPGSQFRVHFVDLTNAVGKGDLGAAHEAAQRALAIAGEHGWMAMQVAVYAALGSGYVGGGHTDHAVTAYQSARQAAFGASEQGDPSASKLIVQGWLGEGSALVGAGRFAEAAPVYVQAAQAAGEGEDPLMALEGWRMAAYCHEQAGDAESAWACGHTALEVGERMDEGMRGASTLPFAGQGLLRITRQWAYAGQEDAVRARMSALLGADWESAATVGGSPS